MENDADLNNANRCYFELRRYKVHTATSLTEARSLLGEAQPDIIMMEAVLPDGDGFDFCKEIYGKTQANIIFLTSRTGKIDMVKGMKSGADEYIGKPYCTNVMMARVEAVMRRRKWEQHSFSAI